ncbi:hypothetical protein ERY13_33310 [Paenibacillus mucilaginosus]|nr:hypothetical protein ERY13_33310 [Paenibacillus mucilaginosus]
MTYEELRAYVPKDFMTFMSEGLTPVQAASRLIDEYEIQTDDYEDVSWLFTVLLAELGVSYHCLSEEVKAEALGIIDNGKLIEAWKQDGVSESELELRSGYLEEVKGKLLNYGS